MTQQRRYTLLEERHSGKTQQRKPSASANKQHKSVVHPQSDLQPVYDVLDALQFGHLKAAYNRLSIRTRWFIIIGVATLVLVWATVSLSGLLVQHIRATSGPFLMEALQPPYNLVERLTPETDPAQMTILPMQLDTYVLNLMTVQTLHDGIAPVVEADAAAVTAETTDAAAATTETTDAAAPVEAVVAPIQYLMGNCLVSAGNFDPEADAQTTCVGVPATYLTSGLYEGGSGSPIYMAAARFNPDVVSTSDVMKTLKDYAEGVGRSGNYVIGIGAADFFYSTTPELYSFVWAHNGWVYVISGPDMPQLETALKVFPF